MNDSVKNFLKLVLPSFIIKFAKRIEHYLRPVQSRIYIGRSLMKRDKIYLEIGAGNRKGEKGWVTLDLTRHCDIYWDLNKGLPFPDKSIHKIYSSHVFEHFTFNEGQRLLAECLRVLVPEGEFSVYG